MSTFKLKTVVVETVEAWDGRKWHEAVEEYDETYGQLKGGSFALVNKSTILAREYIPCDKCKSFLRGLTDGGIEFEPCEQCTAGEWEVADD